MSLTTVTRKLLAILEPHGVVIGGVCGMMHGVERFTRDVDLATDLLPEKVILILGDIEAEIQKGDALDPLPWVIKGVCDGIEFQVLPAKSVGVSLENSVVQVELRIASEEDFITSKCIAGGQQDLHDVAVMALQNKGLKWFAMQQANTHDCRDKLDGWLEDERLKARYGS